MSKLEELIERLRKLGRDAGEKQIIGFMDRFRTYENQMQEVYEFGNKPVAHFFNADEARLYAETRNALPELLSALQSLVDRNERLEEVARGVAKMKLIDATEENGEVVFRFTIPGRLLFNPPGFIKAARSALPPEEQS